MSRELIIERDCDTAADLLEELSPAHNQWGLTGGQAFWIFRGQREDWPLSPSAFRPGVLRSYQIGAEIQIPVLDLETQIDAEHEVFVRFKGACDRLGMPVPEDSQLTRGFAAELAPEHGARLKKGIRFPHDLLRSMFALAQHHGVPTRLLDWSQSPYVAAYFAAHRVARAGRALAEWRAEHSDEDGVLSEDAPRVPAFDPDEKMVVWGLRRLVFQYSDSAAEDAGFRIAHVTVPYASNANIRAQLGSFTLVEHLREHDRSELASLHLVSAVERTHAARRFTAPAMIKLTLPHSQAGALLRELRNYRVSYGSVFPGYDGAVEDLREPWYWSY